MSVEQQLSSHNPLVTRLVNRYLGEHSFEESGRVFWKALRGREGEGMAQMRGLQNTVYTALRFNDIPDFVKNQMGRDVTKREERWTWVRTVDGRMAGQRLLDDLRELKKESTKIAQQAHAEGIDANPHTVALHLARGWMRQVSAHFMYLRAKSEVKRREETSSRAQHRGRRPTA